MPSAGGIHVKSPPPLRRTTTTTPAKAPVKSSTPTGIRVVEPLKHMPGLRRSAVVPPRQLPPRATFVTDNSEASGTTLSSDGEGADEEEEIVPKSSRPRLERDESSDDEASLWGIVDREKVRPPGTKTAATELDSADSSERLEARKKAGVAFERRPPAYPPRPPPVVSKLPPRPPPPPPVRRSQQPPPPPRRPPPPPSRRVTLKDSFDDDDNDDMDTMMGGGGFGDDDDDEDDMDMMRFGGEQQRVAVDPLEEATLKAVRKAKLLARIEQLTGRGEDGVAPSKLFTYKSSEEELLVEVARMEVLAERAIRVEQGRSFLLAAVTSAEKGACKIDEQPWLPFHFNLQGFSKKLRADLWKYDDCLERGISSTIGTGSTREWWIELLLILVPSMAYYSFSNNFMDNPAYANEVLKANPEFQQKIAREMAREMTHGENKRVEVLEQELRKTREEVANLSTSRYGPALQVSPPTTTTPPVLPPVIRPGSLLGNQPPPRPVPTSHPLGDYPVDEAATREMQAMIAANNAQKKAAAPATTTTSTKPLQPADALREQQHRDAIRQRQLLRQAARKQPVDTNVALPPRTTTVKKGPSSSASSSCETL